MIGRGTGTRPVVGPVGSSLGAYWRLLAIGPLVDFAYRSRTYINVFRLATRIWLFYALWTAVYHPGQTVAGMGASQAVAYSVMGALQSWSRGRTADALATRVGDGSVLYLFLRPMPALRYYLVQRLGSLMEGLAWLVLGTLVAWAVGLVELPASVGLSAVYLGSVVLAGLVSHYLYLLLDLSSFWTIRNGGLTTCYAFLQQLLGGAFIPIWFFPGWLRSLALALPFQATANIPLSLYVGRLPLDHAALALLEQLGWCIALAAVARGVWWFAERRVTIQGG